MAHVKVVRRSMSPEQWARLQFERVSGLIIAQSAPTTSWQVRNGQYYPDGYVWNEAPQPINPGEFWGRPDGVAEFTGTATVPPEMAGRPVWLKFLAGGEVMVHVNETLLNGLDPNRTRLLLTENAQAGQTFDLRFEAYTRSKPDDDRAIPARDIRGCVQCFNLPRLVVIDEAAMALKYDLDILYGLAFGQHAAEDVQTRLHRQIETLLRAFPLFDSDLPTLRTAVPQIKAYLDEHIFCAETPFGKTGKLACVGHSHLDIAYHWTAAQTVQKNARTCLIQLRLMDRYPELSYTHSQAWAYETLERYYPELFAEVKQRIAEGRWEIVGGMYVEPDCNLPSAEALARQIIYGKLYFLEKFGVEVDNCWLPDVFGNTAILPQILKLGGIDYFVSNKMSTWNDTNRFPHNNFIWRGLDGSDIFACVPPTHFISWFEPDQVIEGWDAFIDKDTVDESLFMYGFGDGGSGVTEEMLEHYRRLQKSPGVPELRLTGGREYLHRVFARPEELSVWDGELYLEMHRGTFTTKGDMKRFNRRGEFLAQEVETLCALASLQGDADYPVESLRAAWKKLLLNQFHDIIPGSHTNAVYHESLETYAQMQREFETLRTAALDVLAPPTEETAVTIFNPAGHIRDGLVVFDADPGGTAGFALQSENGVSHLLQTQAIPGGGERTVAVVLPVPPLAATNYRLVAVERPEPIPGLIADPARLENDFFRLEFDERGALTRIFDKRRKREILPAGGIGNNWQLFEDKPGKYNAWDILPNYVDHPIALPGWESIEVVETGPLSVALKLRRTFEQSRAEQIIRLHKNIPRIDFETWVEWSETERLLKVAFPVTVKARHFTTDTSAGGLERENHQNTPWQQARFEVCTHKWTDLSEGLFGVALLNDSKYGADVQGNVLRLSLLRAPIRPDRVSDKGEHCFTYSLFTHSGNWGSGGVVEAALDLNWPLRALPGRRGISANPALTIDAPALSVQALKLAEDGSGDVIIRLVELYGSRGTATLQTGFAIKSAAVCDLLERLLSDIPLTEATTITLGYSPYQIQTVRLKL
jgi:alpha-mannosidase